jgi:hypothetical protein
MRLFRGHILLFHLLAIAAASPLVAHGQDSSGFLSTQTGKAFRTLTHAQIFNLGGFGFGQTMTREEEAFRLLRNAGNSVASFQSLLREANPEGQLYALYGLYLEDAQLFKNAAERLKHDAGPPARWDGFRFIEKGKIRFGEGCVAGPKDRCILLEQMANGHFDQAFKALTARAFSETLKH